MKYFFAFVTLLALIAISAQTLATSPQESTSPIYTPQGGSHLVLIEAQPTDVEGWVDIALVGSKARTSSQTGIEKDLVHLPFSPSGNTKILINMKQVDWVYTSGNTTQITAIGLAASTTSVPAETYTIRLSNMPEDHLAEMRMAGQDSIISMTGPEQYIINAQLLQWAKLPRDAQVHIVK